MSNYRVVITHHFVVRNADRTFDALTAARHHAQGRVAGCDVTMTKTDESAELMGERAMLTFDPPDEPSEEPS